MITGDENLLELVKKEEEKAEELRNRHSVNTKAKNVLKYLRIADAITNPRLKYTMIQKATRLSQKYKEQGVI